MSPTSCTSGPTVLTDPSIPYVAGNELPPFIAAAIREPLARLAFANLRTAIESPDDTGYLAYRAVESVRQWFLVEPADDQSARERSDMRAALAIDGSRLRCLETLALARRHGAAAPLTEIQR